MEVSIIHAHDILEQAPAKFQIVTQATMPRLGPASDLANFAFWDLQFGRFWRIHAEVLCAGIMPRLRLGQLFWKRLPKEGADLVRIPAGQNLNLGGNYANPT